MKAAPAHTEAMNGTARTLLKRSRHSNIFRQIQSSLTGTSLELRTLSSSSITTKAFTFEKDKESRPDRDSEILEQFRLRKLRGSSKTTQNENPRMGNSDSDRKREEGLSFNELGLSDELSEAAKELGISFPSEIHCVGIPAILDGKSVVLSSHYDSVGCFTYLLPLIQLLRRNAEVSTEKPKGPRAIVVCSTEELAEELFRLAKLILEYSELKSATENGRLESNLQEDASDVSIGMLVSTPDEVLQLIEEGNVVFDDIEHLVFDEVEAMFDHGLGPEIQKLLISPLKEGASKCNHQGIQTILVTSMMTKILREDGSSLVEDLERNHGGEVAAMLVEVEQTEAFHLLESPEALQQKVSELVQSLHSAS